MRDIASLLIHLIATPSQLARHRGLRSVLAESVLLKHQLLILNPLDTELRTCAVLIDFSPVSVPCSFTQIGSSDQQSF
jgi:hypothetical protein